jgi:acyl carrier protein
MSRWDHAGTLRVVLEIIGARLDLNPDSLDPKADIVEQLGADSLDILTIAAAIENRFDIDIPNTIIQSAHTAGEIADRLWTHLQSVASTVGEP